MRKFVNTFLVGVVLASGSIVISGCNDETGTKTETKISTPGGTTTEARETKVDKTGQNPPLAPSEKR
jgi:hypothetical protein